MVVGMHLQSTVVEFERAAVSFERYSLTFFAILFVCMRVNWLSLVSLFLLSLQGLKEKKKKRRRDTKS